MISFHSRIRSGLELTWFSFVDEAKTILSDSGALLILFIGVWSYAFIYSIAYMNNVVRDIPIAVVNLDKTASSRTLVQMIDGTKEIQISCEAGNMEEAKQLFWDGKVKGIVLVPSEFEKKILRGEQATVNLYCDASYFLLYKETLSGAIQSSGTFSAGIEIRRLLASGSGLEQANSQRDPMPVKLYSLFNPAGSYGSYVMPGMILIILQQTLLIGIGMVGGAGKEKRNNQNVRPGLKVRQGMFSVVFGKGLIYFLIYAINLIFTLIYLSKGFHFPDKGCFLDVLLLMVPYLFSVIFLGLFISMIFRRREHSIMSFVFISPIVLFLSGLSWPSGSIPPILAKLAYILPSTSAIPAFLRIRTMGASLQDVRPELTFLVIQMVIYFLCAAVLYKISVIRQARTHQD